MGCRCGKPKRVRWQHVDEDVEQNKFRHLEWHPKVVKKIERNAIPRGTYSVRLVDDERDCHVTDVTFLPNGDIFVVDQNNKKLKYFDSKFRFKSSVQMPVNPEGACSVPREPYVYVTFPSSNKIRQVEIKKNEIQRVETIQTVGKCTGICSNKHGGLAVSVNTVGNQWQIHLMNSQGILQKRVYGDNLFLQPDHVAITADLNLVVSDRCNHTVFHITTEGYVIFAYREILGPRAVIVDKMGYIYVAGPERIHQLNERGERVAYILSKIEIGFAPLALAYRGKEEMLIVAGRSDKLKVYTLT